MTSSASDQPSSVAAPSGAPNMPYASGNVTRQATQARGVIAEVKDDMIVLALPGTDYRMHLQCDTDVSTQLGKRITGTITAQAKRVDVVTQGGRYIEPLYGRPRRVQGRIAAADEQTNTLTVACGCAINAKLMSDQSVTDFNVGDLVSFDIERGARFEPEAPAS